MVRPTRPIVARVIALNAGVPIDRVAHTVNRNLRFGHGVHPLRMGLDRSAAVRDSRSRAAASRCRKFPLLWNSEAAVLVDACRPRSIDVAKDKDARQVPTATLQTRDRIGAGTDRPGQRA